MIALLHYIENFCYELLAYNNVQYVCGMIEYIRKQGDMEEKGERLYKKSG